MRIISFVWQFSKKEPFSVVLQFPRQNDKKMKTKKKIHLLLFQVDGGYVKQLAGPDDKERNKDALEKKQKKKKKKLQ